MTKIAIMLVTGFVFLAGILGCEEDSRIDFSGDDDADTDTDTETDSPTEFDTGTDTSVTDWVEVVTSMGTFVVGLYGDDGPITVGNFLDYVDAEFYSGLIFHRVVPGFVVQGGGFDEAMIQQPTNAPIQLQIIPGLNHEPGVISMARITDPNSATSQFFICVDQAPSLDDQYAAFGRVISGYDVVESISLVQTDTVGVYENVPVTPVVIQSITRL